jgi:two-component system phosphate regulon response regulator PhoB
MTIRILVVEDEPAIQELIAYTCKTSGFEVIRASNVGEAQQRLQQDEPDLILLDWMLPDCSGLEWLRLIRKNEETKLLPVIMLTARGQEDEKVAGLESGADDYVVKPFSPRELVARIRTVIRRHMGGQEEANVITYGSLQIDSDHFDVKAGGVNLKLSLVEFKLISLFAKHPGRVYSRQQIIDKVWGYGVSIDERTVDVHMLRLRKQLSGTEVENFIETVRGLGYRAAPLIK